MALLIKNGEIVTASQRYVADIFCEGETITRIDRDLAAPPGAEVIDATGKYVFPGFIDPHTHVYLPFMGTFAKDNYESASRAALIGGTTTLFDMCCPARDTEPAEGFRVWTEQSAGKSACDYSFHMGVTRFDDASARQLREIVKQGVASFKIFLAYKGAFGIDDAELYRTLSLARELGVVVAAHCENETLVSERQRELLAAGVRGPAAHHESRPPIVEAEGVHHLMTFAQLTGAHVYIVHLSCEEALQHALAARARGVNVRVETLIQYLLLDRTDAERPDFEGAKYVMSPPLRDRRHQAVLWDGLRGGLIDTVATDHAPFDFQTQKTLGRDDFTKIPNGIPALEDRVNLLFTHGVKKGRLDLQTFVDVASTRAAKIFGLFPRKGTIQPGADADLVVYDPDFRGTITAAGQTMNLDYSAFEGWTIEGRPGVVTLRGEVAVRDGKFVGTAGRGEVSHTPTGVSLMPPISTLIAAFISTTRAWNLYFRLLAIATVWFFVPEGLCAGTKDLPVAPNWSLKNLDGTTVRLSDFRGKVVILDFWTTWCPPCRKEMPGLVELQKRYGARGLVVIGVSLDEETRAVKPVAQSLNVNYPIVLGTPAVAELYGGVAVVPSTFVINREGKVTALHEGYTEAVTIETEIKPLL